MSSRERFLAACAQQPHILKAHCFTTGDMQELHARMQELQALTRFARRLRSFLSSLEAARSSAFSSVRRLLTSLSSSWSNACNDDCKWETKDFKEGKTNGQRNGESIGVGNQGETLARMKVELWARLSACFWAYKTQANRRHKWRPPVDPFHAVFTLSHHLSCYTALSLLAWKCFMIVSCYALMACSMWSRGSWLGDSWFPHSAVLLPSLDGMALCLLWFCFFYLFLGLAIPISKLIQRYHLTLISSLWTGPPITSHCFLVLILLQPDGGFMYALIS